MLKPVYSAEEHTDEGEGRLLLAHRVPAFVCGVKPNLRASQRHHALAPSLASALAKHALAGAVHSSSSLGGGRGGLLVHRAHMPAQIARLPKRSVAVRARVVSALLVHREHMRPQIARHPKRSVALQARVVSALLVHRAHMRIQMADVPGLVVALRARMVVYAGRLFRLPHRGRRSVNNCCSENLRADGRDRLGLDFPQGAVSREAGDTRGAARFNRQDTHRLPPSCRLDEDGCQRSLSFTNSREL